MPAVSKKQQKFFGYLLSNPEERKKKGISKKDAEDFAKEVKEVAPPGWGHTKAEKEKTKPWKPKSKIGGTAAAFKRALDDGRFKGLPGSKTKKEKTADMFKLMWSMKKKGDNPHYKPGTDKKYKKYQEEEVKDKQGLDKYDRHKRMIRHKQDKYGRNVIGADYNLEKEREAKGWKNKLNKEEKEKRMSPMQDNNFFGNAYAYEKLKKKIGSKKKHTEPAHEGVKASYSPGSGMTYSSFYKRAKESMADAKRQKEKARKNKEQSERTRQDSYKHGIKFSDVKGSGRIVKGKKVYD